VTELADETATVGSAFALPDDDDGKATTPTEASAAALSMMIDTTMANPTARTRRDRMFAFISYLGRSNPGCPGDPLQEPVRDRSNPRFVRRGSLETLTGFFSRSYSDADVTTLVNVVTARQFLLSTVGAGISLCGKAYLYDSREPVGDWSSITDARRRARGVPDHMTIGAVSVTGRLVSRSQPPSGHYDAPTYNRFANGTSGDPATDLGWSRQEYV